MYELADALRPFQSARVAKCGRVRIAAEVEIVLRDGKAHYHGLMRCANGWACPVCALAIRTERAAEVRRVVEWHGPERAYMLTATAAHGFGDDLGEIRRGVAKAWRKVQAGEPWQRMREKYGFVGSIRAMEVTHGANGFHPRIHVVLLLQELNSDELPELEAWISRRWERAVIRILGESARPSSEHGVDLRPCAKADYVSKLGLEVTAPVGKAGREENRSPLQIASDYSTFGDEADLAIWRAYCLGMFGAKMLTWSRGLRKAAGLDDIKSDEDIVQGSDAEEQVVARISGRVWSLLRDVRGMRLRLLVEAETGDGSSLARTLAGFAPS
jgi:hypothetical protein